MHRVPWGLLQDTGEDTTVLAVVVLAILAGVGFLVARGALDRLRGTYRERAVYQLVRSPAGDLELPVASEATPGEPVELDADAMDALVDAIEARNEMRLHAVVTASGDEIAFETYAEEHGSDPPRAILVEDSRGLLRINLAGMVEAQPPLDDAVTGDLLEVLEGVLGG